MNNHNSIAIDGIIKSMYGGDMMTVEFKGGLIGVRVKHPNINSRNANVGDTVHVHGNLRGFGHTFIIEALTVIPVCVYAIPL